MLLDIESLLDLVRKRRSVRSFKPEPIPDEYVEKILEAARWAPSGANSQPWEFVVVREEETKDKIVSLYQEMQKRRMELLCGGAVRPIRDPGFRQAPVFIILCGDPRTKKCYPSSPASEKIYYSGLASAFLYMHLAATSLGLGSQWVTGVGNPLIEAQVKDLLGIPQLFEIYDMMAVGYPAVRPGTRPCRKLNEIVHYDRYDQAKFRADADILKGALPS